MIRKRYLQTVVAIALGLSGGAALAANLSNGSGQSCGSFIGTWHFVNNQTEGAAPGSLSATFSTGSCTTTPSAINKNNQHFYCISSGTLIGANTNLPGRLVLSDYTCNEVKEPPCDPKKEICPPK